VEQFRRCAEWAEDHSECDDCTAVLREVNSLVLINAFTGELGTGSNFSGYPTNQELTHKNATERWTSNFSLGLLLGEERERFVIFSSFTSGTRQVRTGTVGTAARHHVYDSVSNPVARAHAVFALNHCGIPNVMIPVAPRIQIHLPDYPTYRELTPERHTEEMLRSHFAK